MFKIRDYVEFDDKGRAVCPCCASKGKTKDKTLSIVPGTDGAYKCHRGCHTEDIRAMLGAAKPQLLPQSQVKSPPSKTASVSPQKVREAHQRLAESDGPAKQWLHQRGITDEMMARYQLGISRAKVGDRHLPSITIPLPNDDGTAYYQKKRVMPWLPESEQPPQYKKWSQFGIPAMVWFTWLPAEAKETWLCEGEWDAILLGWMLRKADSPIAVASFTCGCNNVPPDEQIQKLPGQVRIFYDCDDAGQKGSRKAAIALGDRARIAQVPKADDCQTSGWDVSDAINAGFTLAQFAAAAANAVEPPVELKKENPLRARLVSNDELIARAPDYVEWLVPDLLTTNELFALAAPPRGGKSLMAMALARCVATGEKFLDRPVAKGPVIYVNLEDSEAKIKEREESQQWGEGVPVYWLDKFKLTEMEHLIELIQEIRPKLVILDTLSRIRSDAVAEGSAEMGLVLEPLQETAKQFNVCILLIHHTKKIDADNASTIDIFDTMRGSGAIRATCRGVLIIAPAENSYRLVAENGHGKHDLKIRIDSFRLEWQLLGRWNPVINLDQREQVLNYLIKVNSATIDEIWEETQIPKRSLYTVLARLCADELVCKTGERKAAVYHRPIQLIQQLNSVLNSSNADTESDVGSIQQKNNFFFSSDHPESDHPDVRHEHSDDHFRCPPEKVTFVELGGKQPSNADTASDSAIQQQFNKPPFVELEAPVELQSDHPDVQGEHFESDHSPSTFAVGSKVGKRGKRGWRGTVRRLFDNAASVLWVGDRRACRELLEDLELVEEGEQSDANAT